MAVVALIAVTAAWGVTFVQVKDAVALYPLFAFLAVRFAIARLALALPAAPRVRRLGPRGSAVGVLLGLLLASGYALQTAGLQRLLAGVHADSPTGDALVLAAAAVYSLQIVLMERVAPLYDAVASRRSRCSPPAPVSLSLQPRVRK